VRSQRSLTQAALENALATREEKEFKMSDTPKLSLDFKGLLCPMPVVKLAQAIKQIQVGELVEAVATDPGVMADIPAWARSTGNELVSLEKQDKVFKFVVKRAK
jgi:tRNA 2-thiouridine synthesizing protein A